MKLPILFQTIIEHDRRDPRRMTVVPFHAYARWMKERQMLRISAEKFIERQKGGDQRI